MPPKTKETKEKVAKEKVTKEKVTKQGKAKPEKAKPEKEKAPREYDPMKGERLPLMKSLYKLKALGETDAVDADKIADKSGITKEKVKHYFYKDGDLVQNGYVGIAQGNGRSLGYYLTPKGVKLVSV